jgi:hypothetical protein
VLPELIVSFDGTTLNAVGDPASSELPPHAARAEINAISGAMAVRLFSFMRNTCG